MLGNRRHETQCSFLSILCGGISERAYIRSFNSLHNGLDIKMKIDVRELAIRFGCVRIIPLVRDGLKLYKDRFISLLPASRRASADFAHPIFTAMAFYLCAKKQKLKVDKLKLIDMGRFCTGYGIGVISFVVPVYIAEIAPKNLQGGLATTNQLMIVIGASVSFLIGSVLSWR